MSAEMSKHVAPPGKAPKPKNFIEAMDLVLVLTFFFLFWVAWFVPERNWPKICRLIARLHVAVRKTNARELEKALKAGEIDKKPAAFKEAFLAAGYEEATQMLREHCPGGWNPRIEVEGQDHLDTALAQGRGAILMTYKCNYGDIVIKKGLHQIGVGCTHLRSFTHPYSGSWFGRSFLNRIQTSVEDRFLEQVDLASRDLQSAGALGLGQRQPQPSPSENPVPRAEQLAHRTRGVALHERCFVGQIIGHAL